VIKVWGRFGRRFGRRAWFGRGGIGYMRWKKAQEVGDPERALFGLGPCGEQAYQEYKKKKESSSENETQEKSEQQ